MPADRFRVCAIVFAFASTVTPSFASTLPDGVLLRRETDTDVLHISPGPLSRCAESIESLEMDVRADAGRPIRCQLQAGEYFDDGIGGSHRLNMRRPLELVGMGPGVTVVSGTTPVTTPWKTYNNLVYEEDGKQKSMTIYKTTLEPSLHIKGIKQAFVNGTYIPWARYPNQPQAEILDIHTWGVCGQGSKTGECAADGNVPSGDLSGALITLNTGGRFATFTRTVTGRKLTYAPASLGKGPGTNTKFLEGGRFFLSGKLLFLDSPGEWFIDEDTWTMYASMPNLFNSTPVSGTVALKTQEYCVDMNHTSASTWRGGVLANMTFFGCTFRVTGDRSRVDNVDLEYPTYMRNIHLRDAGGPFTEGPPPTTTLVNGDFNTVSRLRVRYANDIGIKIAGNNNKLQEALIEKTSWLGTLDYPSVLVGFAADHQSNHSLNTETEIASFGGPPRIQIYPRNAYGVNNTVNRVTVREFSHTGIVTSNYANTISYSEVSFCSMIGSDACCIHNDNSPTSCRNDNSAETCTKEWHHNWVHDAWNHGMRGDDSTSRLSIHTNVIWNVGMGAHRVAPGGDFRKAQQGNPIVLKTDSSTSVDNEAYSNTNFFSRDQWSHLVHDLLLNNVGNLAGDASRGNLNAQNQPLGDLVTKAPPSAGNTRIGSQVPSDVDFMPGTALLGKAVNGPGSPKDIGAYQHGGENWRPGCTFSEKC